MAAGIMKLRAMFLLLENLHGMSFSGTVGPWVVLGFSVGMEAFDEFLLISVP